MTIPITANALPPQARAETVAPAGGQSQPSAHQHQPSGSAGQAAQASDRFQRALQGKPAGTEGIAAQHADSLSSDSQPSSTQPSAVHSASDRSLANAQQPALDPGSVGLGDRILAGLQRSQNQMVSTVDAVAKTPETQASISPGELLKLQLQVTHDTTSESIAGEVGGKVDNDLQTLLKG